MFKSPIMLMFYVITLLNTPISLWVSWTCDIVSVTFDLVYVPENKKATNSITGKSLIGTLKIH